jgi:hypothetical protein
MAAPAGDAGEFLADVRALEAAGAEMIGLRGNGDEDWILLGAIAAVTHRLKVRLSRPDTTGRLEWITRGRVVVGEPADERWVSISLPPDRDTWAATMREQEATGATGVIVPWDPRLIDLLRNPEPEDRSDLLMSTG